MKSFEDHTNKLDKVLNQLNQKGFKVNVEKSFFTRNELEHIRIWISSQGIMTVPDKVDVNKNKPVPTNKKQSRSFTGSINYFISDYIDP